MATMFVDNQKFTQNGRTYRRVLLHTFYHVKGKLHRNIIANLSIRKLALKSNRSNVNGRYDISTMRKKLR